MKSSRLQIFDNVIRTLEQLRLEQVQKRPADQQEHIRSLLAELTYLRDIELRKVTHRIKLRLDRQPEALRKSTFECMEHDWRENSHSNVLQYLFDWRSQHGQGSDMLVSFLLQIPRLPVSQRMLRNIQKHRYSVEREKRIRNGRIDVLIVDDDSRLAIILENKILSGIGKRLAPEQSGITTNQLKVYEQHFQKQLRGYEKIYVLLSYEPQGEDCGRFVETNYDNLRSALLKFAGKDNIIDEYLILLKWLAHGGGMYEGLREARMAITSKAYLDPKINAMIGLNRFYQIERILHANE